MYVHTYYLHMYNIWMNTRHSLNFFIRKSIRRAQLMGNRIVSYVSRYLNGENGNVEYFQQDSAWHIRDYRIGQGHRQPLSNQNITFCLFSIWLDIWCEDAHAFNSGWAISDLFIYEFVGHFSSTSSECRDTKYRQMKYAEEKYLNLINTKDGEHIVFFFFATHFTPFNRNKQTSHLLRRIQCIRPLYLIIMWTISFITS